MSLEGIRNSAANGIAWVGQKVTNAGQTVAYYGSKVTSSVRPVLDALIAKIRSVSDLAPAFMKNDVVKGLGLAAFAVGLFVLARKYNENMPVQAVCVVAGAILLAASIKLAIINPALAFSAARGV